jgi:hypothetical protein
MCLDGFAQDNRFGAAPTALGRSWVIDVPALPLASPLAALERVASAVPASRDRIECNAPTSTTGKQGPGWADVWQSALRAGRIGRSWAVPWHVPR